MNTHRERHDSNNMNHTDHHITRTTKTKIKNPPPTNTTLQFPTIWPTDSNYPPSQLVHAIVLGRFTPDVYESETIMILLHVYYALLLYECVMTKPVVVIVCFGVWIFWRENWISISRCGEISGFSVWKVAWKWLYYYIGSLMGVFDFFF